MTKKILATSVLVACLATTTLASGVSFAKSDEVYFYPKSKWKVEQVGAKLEGSPKTCLLSNQFNNGYIVQIAGNSDGFTNLNINFRQNSFETNLKYEVKYSIPGVMYKLIPTKAFKKNLLVSDLRGQKEFASALRAASVLDVKVRGVDFRMYMTGFDAAMNEFSDCVKPPIIETIATMEKQGGNLSSTASGSIYDEPLAPPPPASQQDEDLASKQGSDTPQDITIPANKLRPTPSERPRYTEQLAQQLKDESGKYKPSLNENIVDKEEKGRSGNSASIEPEASAFIDNMEGKVAIIESAPLVEDAPAVVNIKSPKPIIHLTRIDGGSVDFTKNGTVGVDKAVSIDNTMEVASNKSMAETSQMLAIIEPTVGQANDDFIDMRDRVSDLEKQVGVLLDKNRMLNEELKIVLQESEKEKMSVSSSNWDLERATIKFNESERQIMRLGRKLQTQKAQCEQEKTELESMLFDPSLTSQQQLASLTSLEAELDTAKAENYRQQRQYEERIKLLEERLEAQ